MAVVCAGWDPGTDSMIRGLLELMAPTGHDLHQLWSWHEHGPLGGCESSDGGEGCAASSRCPWDKGFPPRMVYIELEEGASFEQAREFILSDPYFKHDDTRVIPVPSVADLIDMGHGVVIERKGVSGRTHNQLFSYTMRINNPTLTSQVMVASARATMRQAPGPIPCWKCRSSTISRETGTPCCAAWCDKARRMPRNRWERDVAWLSTFTSSMGLRKCSGRIMPFGAACKARSPASPPMPSSVSPGC